MPPSTPPKILKIPPPTLAFTASLSIYCVGLRFVNRFLYKWWRRATTMIMTLFLLRDVTSMRSRGHSQWPKFRYILHHASINSPVVVTVLGTRRYHLSVSDRMALAQRLYMLSCVSAPAPARASKQAWFSLYRLYAQRACTHSQLNFLVYQ